MNNNEIEVKTKGTESKKNTILIVKSTQPVCIFTNKTTSSGIYEASWCFEVAIGHLWPKCFAFSWRSGPENRVPVDCCWINQVYRALFNCSSSASFRDFCFDSSLIWCCQYILGSCLCSSVCQRSAAYWRQILELNLFLSLLYPNVNWVVGNLPLQLYLH